MQPPEERYIKIGEINTRYWMAGDTGPQVLLIHGVGRFLEEWMLSFDALAAHNRVYALDLPGHGRTDKPLSASYRLVDLARFVNDFINRCRLLTGWLILPGLSMISWVPWISARRILSAILWAAE
jgi:4,5:9,10-diseco-3-hydroxy-5,9,17-trioxoandrosta-1(10),2-diene-4-oate hydrolase